MIELRLLIANNVAGEIRTHDLRFRRPLLYPAEPLRQTSTIIMNKIDTCQYRDLILKTFQILIPLPLRNRLPIS